MTEITITEALAELPTIQKRLAHKRKTVESYLYRPDSMRDPHEKQGGSEKMIEQELQGIADLEERIITIRTAIQGANHANALTIGDETQSIADWLTWRREVAPGHLQFLRGLSNTLMQLRRKAQVEGSAIKDKSGEDLTRDYVININETELAEQIETYETTLGVLDGKLSLANATIKIVI